MTLTPKQEGHLLIFTAMLIFGLNIPITKYLYGCHVISPMAVTLLRMAFGAFMFWTISLFQKRQKVERKDFLILCVGGLLGLAMNQGSFAYGLNITSPIDASIIVTGGPLFAMIISAFVLKEPITFKKFAGVIIGGIGAVILVFSSVTSVSQTSSLKGNMALLGAQLFYATYIVITKPLSLKYTSVTLMKWMFLFSFIALIPLGTPNLRTTTILEYDTIGPLLAIAFILLGSTFFAYFLIPMAQRRIRPTTIAMYNNLQPVIATSVAIALGMDHFTLDKLVSALLILLGVYFVTMSKSKAELEQEKQKKRK